MKPRYKTWIRKKKIALFCIILVVLLFASLLFWRVNLLAGLVLVLFAIPFAYIVCVLIYTYYLFSANGGDFQAKIHDSIIKLISAEKGKLLDIGTGVVY